LPERRDNHFPETDMSLSIARRVRPSLFALAGACALTVAGLAAAQTPTAKVPSADRQFAEKAAMGGAAEVQGGQMAQQMANNEQVKQFGSRMVEDHSKANDELKQIALGKGMELPSQPDAKSQKAMDSMKKKSGTGFDRAYMDDMVADHKKDIADFEKEAKSGKDPEIKAFAAKTLPTLREHLKMAQKTDAAVKHGASASAVIR